MAIFPLEEGETDAKVQVNPVNEGLPFITSSASLTVTFSIIAEIQSCESLDELQAILNASEDRLAKVSETKKREKKEKSGEPAGVEVEL